jgi:apolipoprotein D and lipocalin family protein
MRAFFAFLFLLFVAACSNGPAAPQVSSIANFEPARLAGDWHEVASIGRGSGASWHITVAPGGAIRATSSRDGTATGTFTAPGRFTLTGFAAPLWVLWADTDNRTLLLGTPGRSFALLLDRGAPSADRLTAAREILAWNGYDPAALR